MKTIRVNVKFKKDSEKKDSFRVKVKNVTNFLRDFEKRNPGFQVTSWDYVIASYDREIDEACREARVERDAMRVK